jgi:hypothetical protein
MKRRMLARAGFDESVGRSTPRCLKGDVETPFQHHATAAGGGGASVHAPPPPQPLTIKEKALVVDEASIAETIEMLRRELDVAKESMTYLDTCVDEDIAWVHAHCEVPQALTINVRTVQRCRKMALDRLFLTVSGYLQTTSNWALQRWKNATKYEKLKAITKIYSRAKAIESIVRVTYTAVARQYTKAWRPWYNLVMKQRKLERETASTEIARVVRGFLGRVHAHRRRVHRAALVIQCAGRKYNAKKKVHRVRQNKAAKVITWFFKSRMLIKRAKLEVIARRQRRAATKIQKVFRGGGGG